MKKCIYIFVILFFLACGSKHVDVRADAYSRAASRAVAAISSDELVRISYDLHYELAAIDAEYGPLDSIAVLAAAGDEECKELLEAVDAARSNFEKELLQQEMKFYLLNSKKNKR